MLWPIIYCNNSIIKREEEKTPSEFHLRLYRPSGYFSIITYEWAQAGWKFLRTYFIITSLFLLSIFMLLRVLVFFSGPHLNFQNGVLNDWERSDINFNVVFVCFKKLFPVMDKFVINVLVPTVCQLVKKYFLINSSKPVYLMHPLLPGQHMCCHGYLYGLLSMLKCHVYRYQQGFPFFFSSFLLK